MIFANTQIITFDQWIADFFNNLQTPSGWSYGNLICGLLAVIICIILCGIIGFEREKRGSSAGLRTQLLVGVGSCLIMFISIYGFPQNSGDRDVARLAAQAVSGVGFLGAGTIIHNNRGVKGLTTASTIWLSMAIGLACGSFNFTLAIFSTVAVMFVLIILFKVEVKMYQRRPRFTILADSTMPIQNEILKIANEGYLYIKGRKNNVIVLSNGFNICPEEIENDICKNPLIKDCIIKKDIDSDQLVCEMVLFDNSEAKQKEVTDFLKNVINKQITEGSFIEKTIFRTEDFERTPAMKIIRK